MSKIATQTKKEKDYEYLKMALRDFFEELKVLLRANVIIYNIHKGGKRRLVSVSPLSFKYTLDDGEKDLSHKDWDELDFMLFRRSFVLDDGFAV